MAALCASTPYDADRYDSNLGNPVLDIKGMNDDDVVVECFSILPRANMIRRKAMVPIGLGFRALKGGGVVVGVAVSRRGRNS